MSIELIESREADVGGIRVRRALPRRGHRTVGSWCFLDHMGPFDATPDRSFDVAPHPHTGLQTVTWLVSGEIVHRDSLGSEQTIRPGQLNLMTAGGGVSHSEEHVRGFAGRLHGVQLWVALPDETRHGLAAFEHHPELPQVELDHGSATVLIGRLGDVASPARRDTDHVGFDVQIDGGPSAIGVEPDHEYALVVLDGALDVAASGGATTHVEPGRLALLGSGLDEIELSGSGRAVVVGGVPFPDPIAMWWNFVERTPDEVAADAADWNAGDERFGTVASTLPRIPAPTA